jgi:hypothetical protein
MNRAHAIEYARTGVVPAGAVPVQPGAHGSSGVKRTVSVGAAPVLARSGGAQVVKAASMGASMPAAAAAVATPGLRVATLGRAASASAGVGVGASSGAGAGAKKAGPGPLGGQRGASTVAVTAQSGRTVEVWTDGSCLGNGKLGAGAAYAVYFGPSDPRQVSSCPAPALVRYSSWRLQKRDGPRAWGPDEQPS